MDELQYTAKQTPLQDGEIKERGPGTDRAMISNMGGSFAGHRLALETDSAVWAAQGNGVCEHDWQIPR